MSTRTRFEEEAKGNSEMAYLASTFQVLYYFEFLIFVGPLVSLPKDVLFFNNCFSLICCSYFWDCLYFCQQLLVIDLNVLLEHDIFISLFVCFFFFRFFRKDLWASSKHRPRQFYV